MKRREAGSGSRVAGILGLTGILSTVMYAVRPEWLGWASVPLPLWSRWAGVAAAVVGFALLQWAQNALGESWSDTPRMITGQALVTSGPYAHIRHPMYAAFLLILGSTFLISSNLLIGAAWIGMTLFETISRIAYEESLMLEYFGEEYRTYMQRTGWFFPRLGHSGFVTRDRAA